MSKHNNKIFDEFQKMVMKAHDEYMIETKEIIQFGNSDHVGNPVDTGQSRDAWYRASSKNLDLIKNPFPYVSELEFQNKSKQAPGGWIRSIANNSQARFDFIINKSNKK